jgi:peptidyl-prolyl cis-trans isomerase C
MENKILAKVNDKEISLLNVNDFIAKLEPQTAEQYKSEEGIKHVLNELINQELFLSDAVERKLDETDGYRQELAKARDFILTQMNINATIAVKKVTDTEVKALFEQEPAKFGTQAMADTSHILVDNEELCQQLRSQIVNNEISFEDAATKHSSCPSNERGGNLGSYEKGQMVPEYDNVTFSLEIDEISQPVKTQFGYHLIKLNSKTEAQNAEFDQVKDQVQKELVTNRQRETYLTKINQMRKKFLVEIL